MKKGQRPRRHVRIIRSEHGVKYVIINDRLIEARPYRVLKKDLQPQYKPMRRIRKLRIPRPKLGYRREVRLRYPHLTQRQYKLGREL